jgi:hypothetical protein
MNNERKRECRERMAKRQKERLIKKERKIEKRISVFNYLGPSSPFRC